MAVDYVTQTRTFESVLSTTLDSYAPTLEDNVTKSHPLLDRMKSKGMIRRQDGGVSIIRPVILDINNTIDWYSGYDIINLTPQDPFTVAQYDWTQLGGAVSIDRKTIRKNSGRHQLINLVSALIQNAEEGMIKKRCEALFGVGRYNMSQTSKQACGLHAIVSETPDTYDVGGIDTSEDTEWRNKVASRSGVAYTWVPDLGTSPTAATGPKEMAMLYNNISKGPGGGPDIGLLGQYMYQEYEAGLHPFKRYNNEGPAAAGFENVRFRNMDLFWDEYISSVNVTSTNAATSQELAYFLSSKYLQLIIDSQTDMILSDWLQPETQDAKTKHILWMGNLITTRRKKHGVLTYYSTTEYA